MKQETEARYTGLPSGNGQGEPAGAETDPMDNAPLHAPADGRRMSHFKLTLLAALLLFLLVATLVVFQEQPQTAFPPAVTPVVAAPALTARVQVVTPQRRDLARTLSLPANISPWYRATLYAKVKQYDIRQQRHAADELPLAAAPAEVAALS